MMKLMTKMTMLAMTMLMLFCMSTLALGMGGALTIKPTLDRTSDNYTVVEGLKAILPCTVHNLGTHKVKVVWIDQWNTVLTFNEVTVIDDPRISVTRPHEEEWNLQIDKVKYGDQGLYVCQVNTTPALQQSVMLTVVVAPSITSEIPDNTISVKEGEMAKLTCNATGIPRPTVRWFRQPSYSDRPRDMSRIGHAGEILVIHNVTRHCGGNYECVADNGVAPKVKKTIKVKVRFAPEITLANGRMGQSLGRDTILECVVSGYPQAVTVWQFQGQDVGNSRSNSGKYKVDVFNHHDELETITLSLNIKNITMTDYGPYRCASSNMEGRATKTMVLHQTIEKTRAPPRTTTTTTTTTTRHIIARTFQPHSRQNLHQRRPPPKGRLGVGVGRGHNRERTDVIQTEYGPRTQPAEASIQSAGTNSDRLGISYLFTVISLVVARLATNNN